MAHKHVNYFVQNKAKHYLMFLYKKISIYVDIILFRLKYFLIGIS